MTVNTTLLRRENKTVKLGNDVVIAQMDIDCTVTPLTSAQDYQLFDLPKGAFVISAGLAVRTGEGAAETVDLGVTGALAQFLNDSSVETAGSEYGLASSSPYFATDDIAVTLLANADLTAAKFTVFVMYGMIEAAM